MDLHQDFTDAQLQAIIEEGLIYMCACPAQVCKEVLNLRQLFEYQRACINQNDTDAAVHKTIADSVARSHALLEECLREILRLEQWDMQTLKMPPGLRQKRDRELL